jgi:polar amino acid transport system substrate-binding protein
LCVRLFFHPCPETSGARAKGEKMPRKLTSCFILVAAALVICLLGSNAQAAGELQKIKDAGVLRIAVFGDEPPFGYQDEQGNPQGFDVLVAKRIAKDLLGDENKIEWTYTPTTNRIELLEADRVDIVLANFTKTPDRAEKVDFANPYLKVSIGVISFKDNPITSVEQLKGKKLILNKGTSQDRYFTDNHPEIELVKFDRISDGYNALLDGRGVAFSQDNNLVFAYERENPKLVVGIQALGPDETINPAVKKGNTELLNWLNDEIDKLTAEKFFYEVYDKTLRPVYGETIDPKVVLID